MVAKKLDGMEFTVPAISKKDNDVTVYRRMMNECRRLHLPEDFACELCGVGKDNFTAE